MIYAPDYIGSNRHSAVGPYATVSRRVWCYFLDFMKVFLFGPEMEKSELLPVYPSALAQQQNRYRFPV